MPVLPAALAQHQEYCEALEQCGLDVIALDADARFPDSTFVEDTAVLTERIAILTHPGAPSRRGEVASVEDELSQHFDERATIRPPATLDGGDVCRVADHFFIGVSARTNEMGARLLADILSQHDYDSTLVDIRPVRGLLHLKSGLSCIDDTSIVLTQSLEDHPAFRGFEKILVEPGEEYAANCVRVNDTVLIAERFPRFAAELTRRGFPVVVLPISEFRKMDGGLSCLSLRF